MSTIVPRLAGLHVAAFESRRSEEFTRMLERLGARVSMAPSLRETPLQEDGTAVAFAQDLIAGKYDVVVLMTGVGLRLLLQTIEGKVDRAEFLAALGRVVTVSRGPKPVGALREVGLRPSVVAPEPNTWRELLAMVDREAPVGGKRVAVCEYGVSNTRLLAALRERGAEAESVRIYCWTLPDDIAPLEHNVRQLASGQVDVVAFTSSPQIVHLKLIAERLNLWDDVLAALNNTVVASIGPTCSEAMTEMGLPVDLEPPHPKLGHLVQAIAETASKLVDRKRRRLTMNAAPQPNPTGAPAAPPTFSMAVADSPFLKACRREPSKQVPIWLMRQAGRYMPEYRAVRDKVTFLELCKNPQLCAEVMVTAVTRLGVDAAIIFSDLLPILEPMGFDLEFAAGDGPRIHNPLRSAADLDRVKELEDVSDLHYVFETVRQTKKALPATIPVIGFAGAPFTLASYAIEGGGSRNYAHVKTLMYTDEGAWRELMGRLARTIARYLNAQIEAGAHAVQIFDSWAGCLSTDDYRRYVAPFTKMVVDSIARGTPVINFATGNPALLPLISETGGAVIGIDWRVRLEDGWRAAGWHKAVQGNLDPCVLLSNPTEIRRQAKLILDQVGGRPGH
ncbi:MAG TPA: uroporphyrinogen decarboxylase, partial [Pirellulales bacterium]